MKRRLSQAVLAAALAVTFALTTTAFAQEVLHIFTGADGRGPIGNLVADAAGNLYGTTGYGGNSSCTDGCGLVFELTPTTSGPWKETVLYHFMGGRDGYYPRGLALDASGNLYGVTYNGGQPTDGTKTCVSGTDGGCGTVYRLSPAANGWIYTLLHSFTGRADGATPEGITLDGAGNVLVTTFGGAGTCPVCKNGTVFEVDPALVTGHAVYEFPSGYEVSYPTGPVLIGSAGNLYGTALGGTGNWGGVYELTPDGGSTWTESVGYSFTDGNDGNGPHGPLVMDSAGNLYGTAYLAGAHAFGTVFELTLGSSGDWTEATIYAFTGGNDGSNPFSGVTMDAAGNLFGETASGGSKYCSPTGCGSVFELSPSADGWTETTLLTFSGKADGSGGGDNPILIDQSGNLYGTAFGGGSFPSSCPSGCGLVFEFPGVAVPAK